MGYTKIDLGTIDKLSDHDFALRLQVGDGLGESVFYGVYKKELEAWLASTPRETLLRQLARLVLWDIASFTAMDYSGEFADTFGSREEIQAILDGEAEEAAEAIEEEV